MVQLTLLIGALLIVERMGRGGGTGCFGGGTALLVVLARQFDRGDIQTQPVVQQLRNIAGGQRLSAGAFGGEENERGNLPRG